MLHLFCPPSGPELATCHVPSAGRRSRSKDCGALSRSRRLRLRGWSLVLLLAVVPMLTAALCGCGGTLAGTFASGSLQIAQSSVSFGNVSIGSTATATVTVTNLGSAPVAISALNVSGKGFSVAQGSLPTTLAAAGGTYTINVNFIPASAGAATGQLTVSSNSAGVGSKTVDLNGTGVTSAPAPPSSPDSPSLSRLTCTLTVAGPAVSDPCTVSLTAAAPSGGIVVNLASSNPAVSVPASVTVPEGASSAKFTATVASAATAQRVTLTATVGGVTENFSVQVEVAAPTLAVSISTMDFGSVAVNTPVTQTLTISSTGAAALTISSATLTGAGFSVTGGGFPLTLNPGQSAALTVQFDPAVAGATTGALTFASNSSTGAATVVALSGSGVPALSAFSCTTGSFTGSGSDTCTVTLNAPAGVAGYAISLSSNNSAVGVPASVTVASGASSATFAATVSTVTSTQTATLSASIGATALTFSLRLNAVVQTLTVSSSSLNFGNIPVNTATTQTVTLSSSGSGSVTVSSATVSGAGFSIAGGTFPLTLGPNQTTSLTVQFDPAVAGAANGQIMLVSNSSGGNSTTISLSGTGVPVLAALSCANSSMSNSGTDTCTVALNTAAAGSGFTVGLSSSNAAVTVPASVTVAAGSASASFSATVASVSSTQNVTISAIAGSVSRSFTLQLSPASGLLGIDATSIAFGNVSLNTPATQTVTLTSTGILPVIVTAVSINGTGFSVAGLTLPLTLSINQSVTLTVTFDPTAAGASSGLLTIISPSTYNPTYIVSLSGTGVSADYQVNLTWGAPSSSSDPVAGYNVYRSPSGTSNYQLLGSVSSSTLAYTDTNSILNGQSYDYIVESVDASGNESSPSNTATVAIPTT